MTEIAKKASNENGNQLEAREARVGSTPNVINEHTVSQTSDCRYLNKLLMLKGKIDFFIREIPEELYYTNYKKPVAIFENGKTTLVEGFKKKKIVEDKDNEAD